MTKQIKELEEARKAIMDAILNAEVRLIRPECYVEAANQILNLKGDGWRIAIIDKIDYATQTRLQRIIWQGGGE